MKSVLISNAVRKSGRFFSNSMKSHKIFNVDTAIHQTTTKDKYTALVTKNWSVGDAPNGGYMMALAISAVKHSIPFPDPLTMTGYYFNKGLEDEPAEIEVQVLNTTKSSASVSVTLKQQGILRSQYMGTFGTLSKLKGFNFSNLPEAPQLPPPEECFDCSAALRQHFGDALRISQRFEFRSPKNDPFVLGALLRKPTKEASLSCWLKFEDDKPICLKSMAFLLDALPPPVLAVQSSSWVPTLEYTVHFWQKDTSQHAEDAVVAGSETATATTTGSKEAQEAPSDQGKKTHWLRCRYNTPIVINGVLYADAELWNQEGTKLLATSRQMAKVLTPR
jgi:acyl-CoA thioesterase